MIGHINIGLHRFTFVFRHRFEKRGTAFEEIEHKHDWKMWRLGLWYKPTKIVGQKGRKIPSEWKNNLVRSHMLGINLLICKAWVEYNKGGLNIPEK